MKTNIEMKKGNELTLDDLERVNGGFDKNDQQSDGITDLIMIIEKWLFDW